MLARAEGRGAVLATTLTAFAVAACGGGGNNNNNNNNAKPAAPTNLVATASGAHKIDLTWSLALNATDYKLYRGSAAGVQAVAANKVLDSGTNTLSDGLVT